MYKDILNFSLLNKRINECFYSQNFSAIQISLTIKRSHHVKGFQLAPKGSPVSAVGLRQLLQLVYKERLQKIKTRAVGEPPLFIPVLSQPNPAFTKLPRTKLILQIGNYVIMFKQTWRRPELKAGSRHEEISEVAYRHSNKRSFNYICISGVGWVGKAFKYYYHFLNTLNFVE